VLSELGKEFKNGGMVAAEHPIEYLPVSSRCFRAAQVEVGIGCFVISELAKWPELLTQSARGQDYDSSIDLGDGICEKLSEQHEVELIGCLTHAR